MRHISTIGYREIDKRRNRPMLLANPRWQTGRGCLVIGLIGISRDHDKEVRR